MRASALAGDWHIFGWPCRAAPLSRRRLFVGFARLFEDRNLRRAVVPFCLDGSPDCGRPATDHHDVLCHETQNAARIVAYDEARTWPSPRPLIDTVTPARLVFCGTPVHLAKHNVSPLHNPQSSRTPKAAGRLSSVATAMLLKAFPSGKSRSASAILPSVWCVAKSTVHRLAVTLVSRACLAKSREREIPTRHHCFVWVLVRIMDVSIECAISCAVARKANETVHPPCSTTPRSCASSILR